jgi:ubiquinone/menaquinone biosynthesis C-methylase UbiE
MFALAGAKPLQERDKIQMSKFTDQQYLKTDQYKDATNLDARVEIHKRFSTNSYGWFNWVFDTLLKLPADAKILELGCGPAHMWRECSSRIPTGWDITLSDLSSGMVDAAWRNLVVTGRAFQFKEIDAQEIPFENETFDAVIANFMLYHVPDRPKALQEIKRVLKPGGKLIAATVGDTHVKEMMEYLQQVHVDNIWESYANPFSLENGLEQLQAVFPNTVLSRYEDSLNVTEVEPIMAYIRSSMRATELSEDEMVKVQANLEEELKEKGRIFIRKDSGLFEAIK